MTVHDAHIIEPDDSFFIQNYYYVGNQDTSLDDAIESPYPEILLADLVKTPPTKIGKSHGGQIIKQYHDGMLDTIYFTPKEIDAGFITEDKAYSVEIWNAYREQKTVIDVIGTNKDGTYFALEDAVPINIPDMIKIESEITVFLEGAPTQQTTYSVTIGSDTYSVEITGKRVLPFEYEPNWKNPITIKYEFTTVINRNEQFYEQRRPLRKEPIINEEAFYSFSGVLKQKFVNDMRRLTTKVVAVPIYSEAIRIDGEIIGLTTINLKESGDNFFNYDRTQLALLIDIDNLENSELKEIEERTPSSLTFTTPVVNDIKNGVFYPVFLGRIENFSISAETMSYIEATVNFKEMRIA